ncbi:MAG TPA: hypothetical protein VEC60_13225 [Reyranella sp.]|nr:hypothetical protein [Reyranella sp.]
MVKQTAIAAFALVVLPGIADAQGVIVVPRPVPVQHVVISSPPQPSPGDPGYGPPMPTATYPSYPSQAMAPSTGCSGTIRDEYGRLYNCRGDQIGGPLPPARVTRALRY